MKLWILEWGWCGLGYVGKGRQRNLFPNICLGVVRFSWCRGSLKDEISAFVRRNIIDEDDDKTDEDDDQ